MNIIQIQEELEKINKLIQETYYMSAWPARLAQPYNPEFKPGILEEIEKSLIRIAHDAHKHGIDDAIKIVNDRNPIFITKEGVGLINHDVKVRNQLRREIVDKLKQLQEKK